MSVRLLFTIVLVSIALACSRGRGARRPVLGAQSARDSVVTCRVALDAASRDSQSMRISIIVLPFDKASHLSHAYGGLVGAGIHQFLKVPNPLSLHVYSPGSALRTDFGSLTLRSAYRANLHRDGHLTHVRTVGGTRDEAFDTAVVSAMEQLSASGLLPLPTEPAATFSGDSIDLNVVVTPGAMSVLPRVVDWPPGEGDTPLFLLRQPIRRITQKVRAKAGNQPPLYPAELRNAGIEGSSIFEFVVDTSGRVDLSTSHALTASAPQFADAVRDALPSLRYEPMYVEGCPTNTLIQQRFDFDLTQH
jgi:hypothetical protein